jgi:hypothetical protein
MSNSSELVECGDIGSLQLHPGIEGQTQALGIEILSTPAHNVA